MCEAAQEGPERDLALYLSLAEPCETESKILDRFKTA